jgi:hypothetical protein
MRKIAMALAATAALGAFGLNAPASAAEVKAAPVNELVSALENGNVKADFVQYRRYYGGRGYYGGGPRYVERHYYGPRRYGYYPHGYYHRDYGSAAAAGALGLATGAIIGGAIAQSQAQAAPTYVAPGGGSAYCAQRYKSYDPASGTYLGYDGVRHPCP